MRSTTSVAAFACMLEGCFIVKGITSQCQSLQARKGAQGWIPRTKVHQQGQIQFGLLGKNFFPVIGTLFQKLCLEAKNAKDPRKLLWWQKSKMYREKQIKIVSLTCVQKCKLYQVKKFGHAMISTVFLATKMFQNEFHSKLNQVKIQFLMRNIFFTWAKQGKISSMWFRGHLEWRLMLKVDKKAFVESPRKNHWLSYRCV